MRKFPTENSAEFAENTVIVSFLFLRFLVPVVIRPDAYALIRVPIAEQNSRTLLYVGKSKLLISACSNRWSSSALGKWSVVYGRRNGSFQRLYREQQGFSWALCANSHWTQTPHRQRPFTSLLALISFHALFTLGSHHPHFFKHNTFCSLFGSSTSFAWNKKQSTSLMKKTILLFRRDESRFFI